MIGEKNDQLLRALFTLQSGCKCLLFHSIPSNIGFDQVSGECVHLGRGGNRVSIYLSRSCTYNCNRVIFSRWFHRKLCIALVSTLYSDAKLVRGHSPFILKPRQLSARISPSDVSVSMLIGSSNQLNNKPGWIFSLFR